LRKGDIFALAPEGTRSKDGRLQHGHAGVVLLALETGAPILPLAFWGSENWQRNLKRLRRTPFKIAVGEPFRITPGKSHPDRAYRQAVTEEIMLQLASLLPLEYRGVYADTPAVVPQYLEFIPPG
jgi:1-acyl-sn-glycerol-3-phosphate acyltransferase